MDNQASATDRGRWLCSAERSHPGKDWSLNFYDQLPWLRGITLLPLTSTFSSHDETWMDEVCDEASKSKPSSLLHPMREIRRGTWSSWS